MLALIDGDVIRYSVGFACQKNIHSIYIKGEEEYGVAASFEKKKELNTWLEESGLAKDDVVIETRIEAEPVENCLHSVKLFIQGIIDATGANEYKIYLTGKGNFRETIATILPYKGNRDASHKPVHYDAITDYLVSIWKAEIVDGMEADDAMSIEQYKDCLETWELQYMGNPVGYSTVICSIDKDLDMVPGNHYNWNKNEMYFISDEQATYNFYKQLLTGDVTDNIQGIPGCGPKTAEKILEGCDSELEMYEAVKSAYFNYYESTKGGEEDLTITYMVATAALKENAQLLWMVRELDEDGKPIMWKPPV